MADYYPLMVRALSGLDPNAPGGTRRELYERARRALHAQLSSMTPPLSEREITRERLNLEEAIRRVEEETVQRVRDAAAEFRDKLGADPDDPAIRAAAEARWRLNDLEEQYRPP